MKHRTIENLYCIHPYDIVKIELIGENSEEQLLVRTMNNVVESYLLHTVNVVELIEAEPPIFKVKLLKKGIGIGNVM